VGGSSGSWDARLTPPAVDAAAHTPPSGPPQLCIEDPAQGLPDPAAAVPDGRLGKVFNETAYMLEFY
jgi:hypothetical protein